MSFAVDLRAACATMLREYAADAGITLQVYEGRPASIHPPTAFVNRVREAFSYTGPTQAQRTPQADIVVLHGIWDGKETGRHRDQFVDGFFEWQLTRYHQAGANTLMALTELEDDPNFTPDWLAPPSDGRPRQYYATILTMEGFTEGL